jgi:hypothetical protein
MMVGTGNKPRKSLPLFPLEKESACTPQHGKLLLAKEEKEDGGNNNTQPFQHNNTTRTDFA